MKETAKAMQAYLEYRNMLYIDGKRSLALLAEKLVSNSAKAHGYERQLAEWSSEHNWQERVKEYDKEEADKKLAAHHQRQAEVNKIHQEHADEQERLLHEKITQRIRDEKNFFLAYVQQYKNASDLSRKAWRLDDIKKVDITDKDGAVERSVNIYYPSTEVEPYYEDVDGTE